MSYFLTIHSSHGPVRSAWEPGGPLMVYLAAEEEPAASLEAISVQDNRDSEEVWNSMLSSTLAWLIHDAPGIEIHGFSVGRRESSSIDRLLEAKKAS